MNAMSKLGRFLLIGVIFGTSILLLAFAVLISALVAFGGVR